MYVDIRYMVNHIWDHMHTVNQLVRYRVWVSYVNHMADDIWSPIHMSLIYFNHQVHINMIIHMDNHIWSQSYIILIHIWSIIYGNVHILSTIYGQSYMVNHIGVCMKFPTVYSRNGGLYITSPAPVRLTFIVHMQVRTGGSHMVFISWCSYMVDRCSYMVVHIWSFIYGIPYMIDHIRSPIYG